MLKDPKRVAVEISDWIQDYAHDAGIKSLVVGVSGGIDSAIVYRLCQMTDLPVIPVFLPMNQKQDDMLRPLVESLVGFPDILTSFIYYDLLPLDKKLTNVDKINDKAIGNYSARMRMAKLYLIAELNHGIVVGTTNAPEWLIGYFTKWGDGAVDIEPIKGLLKSEVYQLGKDGFDNPVPESILNVAPSANLWEGQTDEGELGIKYCDLDSSCVGENIGTVLAAAIAKMVISNSHKKCETPSIDVEEAGKWR